ncbi:MAG TPA: glycosyltransferase [Burkholderiaceae bacterium]|nr:glycosyltransferase [Burkholderiaceae bacterium]
MYHILLSVVVAFRNESSQLPAILTELGRSISRVVSDYEIVVVDNASDDDSIAVLKGLTQPGGLPNLQVFALTKGVDTDTANWVGLENALGDFVVVIDPNADDVSMIPAMLEQAARGNDVVFAKNDKGSRLSLSYRLSFAAFGLMYKWFNGVNLAKDAPQFRVLSRRVINFILQHPTPALSYRHLPATAGFAKTTLSYSSAPRRVQRKSLSFAIDRGVRLLVSSTRGPMRMVSTLSLFGAVANLVYSGYVIAVALLKESVAPGWVTLSLQQSGMFLLLSLVLFVLGEYIVQMASLSNEGPLYHVGQEFTSAVMKHREKLNIEDTRASSPAAVPERMRRMTEAT